MRPLRWLLALWGSGRGRPSRLKSSGITSILHFCRAKNRIPEWGSAESRFDEVSRSDHSKTSLKHRAIEGSHGPGHSYRHFRRSELWQVSDHEHCVPPDMRLGGWSGRGPPSRKRRSVTNSETRPRSLNIGEAALDLLDGAVFHFHQGRDDSIGEYQCCGLKECPEGCERRGD
jgi:hypothetical protein